MATVVAPTNKLVTVINQVIDYFIKGFGVDFVYAYLTAQFPFLAWPFFSYILKQALTYIAAGFDTGLKNNVDVIVIRYQDDALKDDYDKAIQTIQTPGATSDQINSGFDAIDAIIHRSK
jgi:hypothetical protein